MSTNFVQDIQSEKRKNYPILGSFFSISIHNHQCRSRLLGNNGEPIYILEPNDSEGDEGGDKVGGKAVDRTEVVVVCKKYHKDKTVVDHQGLFQAVDDNTR